MDISYNGHVDMIVIHTKLLLLMSSNGSLYILNIYATDII